MTEFEEDVMATLAGHVWESFRKYPERIALEIGEGEYTYQELYQAALAVSQCILDLEDPNPFVAVMADKSFACYSGILGILIAGKAYMPVNPKFPASRNRYMLEKANIRTIVAGENSDEELEEMLQLFTNEIFIVFSDEMIETVTQRDIPRLVDMTDPAYLLFTSGTTGQPKGVPVSQGNVLSYIDYMLSSYSFSPDDRFTQIFDLTFDLSVHDIFLAWSSGACLVVPEDNSSFGMLKYLKEKQPTIWFSVPSVVNLMERMRLLKPGAFPGIRLSFFCGEALTEKTAMAWKAAADESKIVNLYGPTEATIAISKYELPEEIGNWKTEIGIVSIGKVFEGNACRTSQVTSQVTCEVTCEVTPQELLLSGSQIVNKYLDNPSADQESFILDPQSGIKWYRTGDLVKTDPEDNLYFLGRRDAEVKISGYRVNLKEIENLLSGYEIVRQAVVLYEKGILLAFILPELDGISEKDLVAFCRERLPWYMVPGKIIFVKEIPLNNNGKVDNAALLELIQL